jgi:hypothetical protein
MLGKGVVEALIATLAALKDEGGSALPVQGAACRTLWRLSYAAEIKVRMCDWDRPCWEECALRCWGYEFSLTQW